MKTTKAILGLAMHHDALKSMLPKDSKLTGEQAWRKLRRIETQAQRFAIQLCNGPELSEAEQDKITAELTAKVESVFGGKPPGFFINRDPRGYALKLQPGSVPFRLHQDWGGYQILAPVIE